MAQSNINTGPAPGGHTVKQAFDISQANFTDLYSQIASLGGQVTTEAMQDAVAPLLNHSSHTNLTVVYNDAANRLELSAPDPGGGGPGITPYLNSDGDLVVADAYVNTDGDLDITTG